MRMSNNLWVISEQCPINMFCKRSLYESVTLFCLHHVAYTRLLSEDRRCGRTQWLVTSAFSSSISTRSCLKRSHPSNSCKSSTHPHLETSSYWTATSVHIYVIDDSLRYVFQDTIIDCSARWERSRVHTNGVRDGDGEFWGEGGSYIGRWWWRNITRT